MSFNYEYYFVSHGKTKDAYEDASNEIWLDIGGNISNGVFDHHNSNYVSTIDVITNEIDLLEETKKRLNINEPVRIYMHTTPDVDALFSCFYLQFFLDSSKEEFLEKLVYSETGKRIIQYVNDIDSGKRKNVENLTLYNLICHLDCDVVKNQWNISNDIELSNKMVTEGLAWVKKTYELIEGDVSFNIYDWNLPIDSEDLIANTIKENLIDLGKYNYERDKREDRLVIKDICIWTKSGELETVKAAIWKEVPLSPSTSYIYARQEGAVVTFVPHHEYGNNAARISINPDINGAVDKYSLVEVAEMYEQLEQIYDKKVFAETGSLRRDYSRPRGDNKSEILHEKPFSVTVDPWYVSSKGDMVDGPGNGGSLIPVEVMIDVLENITKMVKRTFTVEFSLDVSKNCITTGADVEENTKKSLLAWSRTIKQKLANVKDNMYPFVICEVDASLISHNYDILDAYFMSLSDGAYVDAEEKTVLRLDYRTHLYVNQANTVLFIATSDVTRNQIQMDGLLNWSSNEAVINSKLINVFSKVLYQREKFKEIGRFLGAFKENEKKIKKQNEELIVLLAKAQADACIDSQVELDLFKFVYEALNIPELKESVKETMEMVSEYSKERVYANLNFLSIITIPFILFSTLFQMGVIKFAPLLDLGVDNIRVPAVVPWLLFLVFVVIVTIIFFFARKKK